MISPDNKEFTVTSEHEITYILSKFDEDFIYNTIRENLENRTRYYYPYSKPNPNLLDGYEDIFKQMIVDYPEASKEILAKRKTVLREILKILCDNFMLAYEDYDTYDLFTSLKYMYDFLICNFYERLILFFVNFINKEKDALYDSIISSAKKKDISSVYSKKVYTNSKLALINSNLELVLKNICEMDIPLDMYLNIAYTKDIADYLNMVLKPCNDFFKEYIKPIIYSEDVISVITEIRLRIAGMMTVDSNINPDEILMGIKSLEEEQ